MGFLAHLDVYEDLEHKVFVLLKMSLCSNTQSIEVGHYGRRNASSDNECNESSLRNEEDSGGG